MRRRLFTCITEAVHVAPPAAAPEAELGSAAAAQHHTRTTASSPPDARQLPVPLLPLTPPDLHATHLTRPVWPCSHMLSCWAWQHNGGWSGIAGPTTKGLHALACRS